MKCLRIFLLALCLHLLAPVLPAQVDSLRLKELDAALEEYFQTLEAESPEVKAEECDVLISSAKDSLLRQRIALKA